MRTVVRGLLIMAITPLGHTMQASISQDTCSWNLSPSSFEQSTCPLVDITYSLESARDNQVPHQGSDDGSLGTSIWRASPDCFGEYCVWTNDNFFGQGISLITTLPNQIRIAETESSELSSPTDSRKTRIVEIPGKGRGLVAARTIHRGEEVMAAKPALLVHRDVFRELEMEDLYYLMDAAVSGLPKPRRDNYVAQSGTMGGHKNTDILFTNSFQISLGGSDGLHYGNFPEVSMLNHDCRPNLAFFLDQNLTHHTHAVRDIQAGEELTISYVDGLQVRSVRQERTQNTLGFSCSCQQCTLPKKESEASDDRLRSISRIESALSDVDSTVPSPAMVEEYVTLYTKERLEYRMAGAYTLAALNYNMFGQAAMANKYARLSIAAGLLETGPDAADVQDMTTLLENPESHWSWNMKPRQ